MLQIEISNSVLQFGEFYFQIQINLIRLQQCQLNFNYSDVKKVVGVFLEVGTFGSGIYGSIWAD